LASLLSLVSCECGVRGIVNPEYLGAIRVYLFPVLIRP
jgi:hypothetical protein